MTALFFCIRRIIARRGKPLKTVFNSRTTNFVFSDAELNKCLESFQTTKSFWVSSVFCTYLLSGSSSLNFGALLWWFLWKISADFESCPAQIYQLQNTHLRNTDNFPHRNWFNKEIQTAHKRIRRLLRWSAAHSNHFLLGRAIQNLQPGVFKERSKSLSKSWKASQLLPDPFCNRFLEKSFLGYQKWTNRTSSQSNVKPNDMVWMLGDVNPCGYWPLVKVIETFSGQDGLVRTTKLKTNNGFNVRHVVKLSRVLPVEM